MDSSVPALLTVFSEPAIYAEDGCVAAVNSAAEAIGLTTGCPLDRILDPLPVCEDGRTMEYRTSLCGAEAVMRCCRLGAGLLLVRIASEDPAAVYAALPAMVGGIRGTIQELNLAVDGLAETIGPDHPGRSASTLARRSLYRLERIASRLDWFYRLSTGAVSCHPQLCSPPVLLQSFCEYADGLLRTRSMRVDYDDGGAFWDGCLDHELLELIFWEVLSALTAMIGSGNPKIRMRRLQRSEVRITFSIPNHVGELPDLLESLPEIDPRDAVAWPRHELGLGIASMAARLHGGRLLVSADRDGSVRIAVTLRMQEQSDKTLHQARTVVAGGLHMGQVYLSEQLPLQAYDIEDL